MCLAQGLMSSSATLENQTEMIVFACYFFLLLSLQSHLIGLCSRNVFNLPNYGFSICSCHCKLHRESLSQFFFFLLMSIKNSPRGLCCVLPACCFHFCGLLLPVFSPNPASWNMQKYQLHSAPYPGDCGDSSTIAAGAGSPL